MLAGAGFTACKSGLSGKGKANDQSWTAVTKSAFPSDKTPKQEPETYSPWMLQMKRWKDELGLNREAGSQRSDTVLLPMVDGTLKAFEIRQAGTMAPELAEKFPELKSWNGRSIDKPVLRAKLNLDQKGFHGSVRMPDGIVLIEPAFAEVTPWYMVFYRNQLPANSDRTPSAPEKR